MGTYHIHINGIVQGVGFRPMIYNLAEKLQLNGYVKNDNDGVNIFFNATAAEADFFLGRIKLDAPKQAKIISAELTKIPDQFYIDFNILVEDNNGCAKQVLLSPDIAMCKECRTELHEPKNRRYRYPFITCTQCGPRYSIVNGLPYERHATSMQTFKMCDQCYEEYHDINNSRFYSQTNSCQSCGIKLFLYSNDSSIDEGDNEAILSRIRSLLDAGKIVAIKGIGGYLLLCDANNTLAIGALRARKHRPVKPFAILFPAIKRIECSFELNEQERQLLNSPAAPIVLLKPKESTFQLLAVNDIAPGLDRIGIMVPYSPLLDLIAKDFGKPLVATSANISGSPIIYNEDNLDYLFEIADSVVGNNRNIVIPQDDSVVQVSKYTQQQIILRRSRGYAPSFINHPAKTEQCILSSGAFLKSSFTLALNGNVFVSQFMGSGESFESQQMYRQTLEHWLQMYNAKPDVIITDLHPGYFSHEYAIELAAKFSARLRMVQHHEAHFAAVLAENKLIHHKQPILGIIWDGTGLGTDKNIWGGEFLLYDDNQIARAHHFDYFPTIAGDKTALEPRIAALCALHGTGEQVAALKEKFSNLEWNTYHTLIKNAEIFTSSVGRIFDAVASLLNICDKQSFEGEAAMYLQAAAASYVQAFGFNMDSSYLGDLDADVPIPTATLMYRILEDIASEKPVNYIAAKFHYTLVCLVGDIADHLDVNQLCFSGGVFQNELLVDWLKINYTNKYQLYFHVELSPNDENISFGQLVYHENHIADDTSIRGMAIKENLHETLYALHTH